MACQNYCSNPWAQTIIVTVITSTIIVLLFASSRRCSNPISSTTLRSNFSVGAKFVQSPAAPALNLIYSQASASNALLQTRLPAKTRHSIIKKTKRRSDSNRAEEDLETARAAIRRAIYRQNISSPPASPDGHGEHEPFSTTIYRNPATFFRSYMEMEKRFKVYVYEEGEPPLVHEGPCKNLYTTEGRFIEELEMMTLDSAACSVRTRDPARAHVFFLPFSVTQMVHYVYKPLSFDHRPFKKFVSDYIGVVSTKHPFWNRSAGADHFMLSCHDWGPHASRANPDLAKNSIRALCNANISEGFDPQKDVSIPEVYLYSGDIPLQLLSPRYPDLPSRPYLAFFAGGLHGPIRRPLLQHWKGRDMPAMQVHEYLPEGQDYYSFMLRSRFCLCPSGYEVASPRIVEAIYAECVPVIISQGYALPFGDVMRWEAFSVAVTVKDMPRLREILEGVPLTEVERLREGVRAAKKHFVWNQPPKRFDVFNMILHSVWLRRLNLRIG